MYSCRGSNVEELRSRFSPPSKKRPRENNPPFISALHLQLQQNGEEYDICFSREWLCEGHSLNGSNSARPSALSLFRTRAGPTEKLSNQFHPKYNGDSALNISEAISELGIASQMKRDVVVFVASPDHELKCTQIWAAVQIDGKSELRYKPLFRSKY